MIAVYTCQQCNQAFDYGSDKDAHIGYSKEWCGPYCHGKSAGSKAGMLAAAEIALDTFTHLSSTASPYNHGVIDTKDGIYKAIKAKVEEL